MAKTTVEPVAVKRIYQLFDRVCDWSNLLRAARKARLRKSLRPDVLAFQFDLENELSALQTGLRQGDWRPGEYRSFEIHDPKRRLISAAPYRDRVLHHAVCNIIEPIFERTFIHNSYACRRGKGQASALKRARYFARRSPFCLKTDIAKYFPSIDHGVLLEIIGRKIGDRRLLKLIETIIRHPFAGQKRPTYFPEDNLFTVAERSCGLPIGNQTSQLFGNIYLTGLDHLILERLPIRGYVRYMDDLVLFGDSKSCLWQALGEVCRCLRELRLRLHPRKTNLIPTRCGFRFLGFQVFPNRFVPFPETVIRFRRRLRQLQRAKDRGEIELDSLRQTLFAYWGYFQIAGTPNRFRKIVADFPFYRELRQNEGQRKTTTKSRVDKIKLTRSLRSLEEKKGKRKRV